MVTASDAGGERTPLTRKQIDYDRHYRWAVTGPSGAVDFTVTHGGSPGEIEIHYPEPEDSRHTAACDLLPEGTCDGARQMRLPGKSLYKQWVDAGGDDAVIWARLEAFYANRLES
jgi:hypothetical protein